MHLRHGGKWRRIKKNRSVGLEKLEFWGTKMMVSSLVPTRCSWLGWKYYAFQRHVQERKKNTNSSTRWQCCWNDDETNEEAEDDTMWWWWWWGWWGVRCGCWWWRGGCYAEMQTAAVLEMDWHYHNHLCWRMKCGVWEIGRSSSSVTIWGITKRLRLAAAVMGKRHWCVSTNASDCLGVFFAGLCEVCYLDDGIEQMQIHITELRGRIGSLVIHSNISRTILMTMSTFMFDTCTAWPGAWNTPCQVAKPCLQRGFCSWLSRVFCID